MEESLAQDDLTNKNDDVTSILYMQRVGLHALFTYEPELESPNIELADFSQLLDYEYAANCVNNEEAPLDHNERQDVEDEIYRNVVRKKGNKNNIAAHIANAHKPLECIPMLLQDIVRLNVSECNERGGIYHAFENRIRFRTLIVWARMVTPLKTIGNNDSMLCCEIDDGTARMSVSFFKQNFSINSLQAFRISLNREHDDRTLAKHMEKLLEQTEKLLDYRRLEQHQWILIYGQPSSFHKNICINALTILADNDLNCNIIDFEIAFKAKLINWYFNNVPRCMQNN